MDCGQEYWITAGTWVLAAVSALGCWITVMTIIAIIVWVSGKILNYWWQEIAVVADVVDYMRHRDQFKQWKAQQNKVDI